LLQARTVPTAPSVACHFQCQLATWIGSTQLFQLISAQRRQVDVCQRDIDAQAQLGSAEVNQIVQQRLHGSPAANQDGRRFRDLGSGVKGRQVRSCDLDGV